MHKMKKQIKDVPNKFFVLYVPFVADLFVTF